MAALPVIVSKETYSQFNACVHCGLCLPACPTYVETSDEADSPRGRIHLMKAVVDGKVNPSDVVFEHLDRCLVCQACETACPSGVVYHELIEAVRPQVAEAALGEGKRNRSGTLQWMIEHVLPYSKRTAIAVGPLNVARKMGLGNLAGKVARLMSGPLGTMTDAMPELESAAEKLPVYSPAVGKCRGNVVFLRGCVGNVVSHGVNAASIRVITENGFDVHLLPEEPCCGAMAAHSNNPKGAEDFARQTVAALLKTGGDYFVSPIAGCGSQLKALQHTLAHSKSNGMETTKAESVVRKVRDITEFLNEIGIRPPTQKITRTVTYHDPCHLIHAQHISAAPRALLTLIPGLTIVPLKEADMCCGAAGTYNLNQPEMAEKLGARKVQHIAATGAQELITANIGCAIQIARGLRNAGLSLKVRHVVELLAEAYG